MTAQATYPMPTPEAVWFSILGEVQRLNRELKALIEQANAGLAGAPAPEFAAWMEAMNQWYAGLCPVAALLFYQGFSIPKDTWPTGDGPAQLVFINHWAALLPSLEVHFAGGIPIPDQIH